MESRAWPGVQEAEALCVWVGWEGRQSEKTVFLKNRRSRPVIALWKDLTLANTS